MHRRHDVQIVQRLRPFPCRIVPASIDEGKLKGRVRDVLQATLACLDVVEWWIARLALAPVFASMYCHDAPFPLSDFLNDNRTFDQLFFERMLPAKALRGID